MAGYFFHCINVDGSFDFSTIENMGDAHEACEEMFGMIRYLAQEDREKIAKAEKNYKEHLGENAEMSRMRMEEDEDL